MFSKKNTVKLLETKTTRTMLITFVTLNGPVNKKNPA